MTYLNHIELDDAGLPVPSPELEQERRVAAFDLQEANAFALKDGPDGPYRLRLSIEAQRAAFHWQAKDGENGAFSLPLGGISQDAREYRTLCDTYADAVRTLPPGGIEKIDEARRAVHDEAGRRLRDRLSAHADVDDRTARRLFTLICAMTDDA